MLKENRRTVTLLGPATVIGLVLKLSTALGVSPECLRVWRTELRASSVRRVGVCISMSPHDMEVVVGRGEIFFVEVFNVHASGGGEGSSLRDDLILNMGIRQGDWLSDAREAYDAVEVSCSDVTCLNML